MYLHDTLLACPSCKCHARSSATNCPFCGEALRNRDGSRTRTADAVLLGLVLAAAPAVGGCGGQTTVSTDYGVAFTTSSQSATSGGTGGAGGGSTASAGGAGGQSTGGSGGMGGHPVATDYGVPGTTASQAASSSSGGFGGAHTDYGVPPTATSLSSSGK